MRTIAYIHWWQGARTLRTAGRLLQPKSQTVAVAVVRSDSDAVLLVLDEQNLVTSRTQLGLEKSRWWPEGRVTCTDG